MKQFIHNTSIKQLFITIKLLVNYDVNWQVLLYLMAVLFYEELQQADFQQRLVLLLWATFVEAGKQTSHEHFNHNRFRGQLWKMLCLKVLLNQPERQFRRNLASENNVLFFQ